MTSKSWSNPAMMKVESFADCFFGELVISIIKLDCVLFFHDMTCMIVSAFFAVPGSIVLFYFWCLDDE